MIARRAFCAALGTLALGGSLPASAQSYPNRVVRIIAPYTPGSPNDVMVRLLGQRLQQSLGQPVIIDNRPGGGTAIGTKAAAMAPADGYTLLFSSSSLVLDVAMNKKADYDPLKDFAPIAFAASNSWIVTVGEAVPVSTLQEFIAYARANPGKLSFAFSQGTATQFIGAWFHLLNGLDVINVPYKGGAQAIPDILGGRIHTYWPTPATVMPLIREGKLKPLAVTSPTRNAELPNVPTMREAGFPDMTLEFWAGVLAPAGTPPEIVGRLNAAINEALQTPEMKASMAKLGFETRIGSPQSFGAFIGEEIPRWANVVKASGVKID